MPSLFSRSRTTSQANKNSSNNLTVDTGFDEFGRVSRATGSAVNLSTSGKKEKKKDKEKERPVRARTVSSRGPTDFESADAFPPIPDGTFLPLNLEKLPVESGEEPPKQHDYGYLSSERHVVLGLEQVERLVKVVSEEIGARGLTTPFIFSSLALDISSSAIKRLIHTFLVTCANPDSADAERRWRDEARFAGPHELGMTLRWGLARVVRYMGGQDVRGLIGWEQYNNFRDSEPASNWDPVHFSVLLQELISPLRSILLTILSLLSRLTANSASSGHTPPTLSPLFGPLLFGLGPATLAFHHTYHHYLRAANAMEHIMLAFIRWQDTPRAGFSAHDAGLSINGKGTSLGVPTRLKEWIRGYPAMLPFLSERYKREKPQARKGARTLRVVSVRRNVRMYSPDLVKTAATWATRPKPGSLGNEGALAGSKEWERVAPTNLKLQPRYSEGYKKKMDMPVNFHPETGHGPSISNTPSLTSSVSSNTSTLLDDFAREGEDRFRSLTDLKWGAFEEMGFGGIGTDEKKLQFDLTEGARTARAAKRATLSWNDFSDAGFSRTDDPLSATLQFSTPVATTISAWPTHSAEISRKLKKTQKALPAFGWDTEPVMGTEEMIEEAFIDVFCDLIYGGGWMDLERGEEIDRECNWALIEFKSLPVSRSTLTAGADPRSATSVFLFEEFVPAEYRQQLAVGTTTRRRLPSLFSASTKSKQWKQATTLNGRPYVVGNVPPNASYREVEFEGLLRGTTPTKVLSFAAPGTRPGSSAPPIAYTPGTPGTSRISDRISGPLYSPVTRSDSPMIQSTSRGSDSDGTNPPSSRRGSRFRLPGGIPVPSPGGGRKSGISPAEYSTVDFETRLASYSDEELTGERLARMTKKERRQSRDDAWVDILVGTQARRLGGQDAQLREPGRKPLRSGRSDPDLARQEVAQALAAVRDQGPLSDDDDDDEPVIQHIDRHAFQSYSSQIDEVEVVPNESDLAYMRQSHAGEPDVDSLPEADVEHPEPDSEVETDSILSRRNKRRLGYFDLHPERRPISKVEDEDPRERLASSDDDLDDEHPPDHPLKSRDLSHLDDSFDDFVPSPMRREIHIPEYVDEDRNKAKSEPMTLPPGANGNGDTSKSHASKTAALIEMYREREKVPPSGPIPSSRLPVRTGSLPAKDGLTPPVIPGRSTSPLQSPPDASLSEPPRVVAEDSGRGSPARYVHGAPLHNVLEEEEED